MLPKVYGKTEGKEGVMRLDLADLRLFIAIVDTGSITGGAAAAHLALASASECAKWRRRSVCRCCTVMPGE